MMVLVYAFGTGLVGIVLLLVAVSAILGDDDRRAFLHLLRHPIEVIFSDPEPPDEL
jgi:hypothetical protein